jgi:hypothetical protein
MATGASSEVGMAVVLLATVLVGACDSNDTIPAAGSGTGSPAADPSTSSASGGGAAAPNASGTTTTEGSGGDGSGTPSASGTSTLGTAPSNAAQAAAQIAECQSAGSPPTPRCAVRLAAEVYCTKVDCCEQDDLPLIVFLDTCRLQAIGNADFATYALGSSIDAGRASWDGAAFERCLASASDCSNQEDPLGCLPSSITGNQVIGESCTGDHDCEAGASCFRGSEEAVSGACAPLAAPGEPCDTKGDCEFGYCGFIELACSPGPFAPLGASCDSNEECQSGDCDDDGPGATGQCVERRVCFSSE